MATPIDPVLYRMSVSALRDLEDEIMSDMRRTPSLADLARLSEEKKLVEGALQRRVK